ncbi:uncharacterized protein DSM5745_10437 [Aspergillus mulundensis]|uniref:Cytochrome P450 n=1 Tax=Aspergillus mulundensis TaxID=1810919 RepID=A0A3D8QIY2_9EURO|nr:hypothetical protein DSM5745_10437 [Aspergillus mulundensis]RDW61765.1 hypothetical protein DSM5745_10437 [Aspergillus mulundensis]
MSAASTSELPKYPFARPEKSVDPPAELKKLRQQCPVSRIQLFDGTPGWIVTRHKEDRYRREGYPEIHPGAKKEGIRPTFVHMDDEEHATHRAMTEPFFTKSASTALKPQIQSIVDSLLNKIKQKGCKDGPVDLVAELATPLNPKVLLLTIFKVSEKDANDLLSSNASLGGTSGTATESGPSDVHEFITKLVDSRIEKPANPEDDLISNIVVKQYQKGKFDRDGMINLLYMVLVAGNTAIMSSVALGVLTLLQHPEQLDELKKNPDLAENVVEEVLRYHTPSALNSRRVAREDTTLGGQEIKAGTGIIGSVRSANRDEREYPTPDNFDIHRKIDQNKNLAFGYGPHNCQGQWLSRFELQAVFATLFQKLPNLKLAVKPEELEYTPPTQNVGVTKLPVWF